MLSSVVIIEPSICYPNSIDIIMIMLSSVMPVIENLEGHG